jgi:hypothetical protein
MYMECLVKKEQLSYLIPSGVKQISGSVLKSNLVMLEFIKKIGFAETNSPDDPSTLLVAKHLD